MMSDATSQPPDEATHSATMPSAEILARGYEPAQVSIRALIMVLAGLVVLCVLIYVGVWYLQAALLRGDRANDRLMSMIHVITHNNGLPQLQPSGPSHDTTPVQDLAAMRASENAVFDDIGWRDQQTGSISVPADVVHALATRKPPTTAPETRGAE